MIPATLTHPARSRSGGFGWPWALGFAALGLAVLLLVHRADWSAMAAIWVASDTFAHGMLITPISAWLLWRERAPLADVAARPWPLALVGVLACSALWLFGELAGVNALRQFAVVGIGIGLIATVCGREAVRRTAFPLALLFLMVPFGEFLEPVMMERTADVTVWALRITGIPVYREGLHFVLPTGRWSVVEACSGLRYLIASVVLGVVYAYLMFRSWRRRLAFVALSVVVPVVANWLRAYGIVLIGHLSGMTLATGVDHLVYGWLFFGVVMFSMFWIGSRWREADRPAPPARAWAAAREPLPAGSVRAAVVPWVVALATVVGVVPLAARLQDTTEVRPFAERIRTSSPNWSEQHAPLGFRPSFRGARSEFAALTARTDGYGVHLAYYARQHEGGEMIAHGNVIVAASDPAWRTVRSDAGTIDTPTGRIPVRRYDLVSAGGERLLLQHWLTVDGTAIRHPIVAKLLTARSLLTGSGDHSISAAVWLATDRALDDGERETAYRRMAPQVAHVDAIARQAVR